jgi:hypothetical protein
MEVEGVVLAESSAHRTMASPFQQLDFRRVGLLLKAIIKALVGVASKREARFQPLRTWMRRRCGPTGGSARLPWRASLTLRKARRGSLFSYKLINKFREELVDLDMDEVPLQNAPPDTADVGLASDDDEDVARLRALEKCDLQIQVEEAEREVASPPGRRDRGREGAR